MSVLWRTVCDGCRRTCSFCQPAPGTPEGFENGNLYCPECFARGRAHYRKVADQFTWRTFASGCASYVLAAFAGMGMVAAVIVARSYLCGVR